MLSGRLISVGGNFLSQVLIVRYLSTADYGAWAYALAVVAFCQNFATMGLDRAVTRFLPIYHEKRQYQRFFGILLLTIGTALLAGLVLIGACYLAPERVSAWFSHQQASVGLLMILVLLIPVEAIDLLVVGLFASFGNAGAIFFRKHVLGPGLRLLVVLLLVLGRAEVTFLALGYVLAAVAGVTISGAVVIRQMRTQGLLVRRHLGNIRIPAREVFSFSIPLMTSDLVTVAMNSLNVLLLGYFCSATEVALYVAIVPAAKLNRLVMRSFALLYTPSAARLFARLDYRAINHLYWRTTIWMSLLSFPVFVVTFSMAEPLTRLLYGERYQQSATLLALLSLGHFFNVVLGFNGLTLKVLGRVRFVVAINLLVCVLNVFANLLLIPRFGALGAAAGTCASLVVHNLLKQWGLGKIPGLSFFSRQYVSFFLIIACSSLGLLGLGALSHLDFLVEFALAVVVCLLVLILCRKDLKLTETFPELLRLPLMRWILT